MDVEVHNLPAGWRYPVGKGRVLEAFAGVAEGFTRLETPPAGSGDLVAEATVTRATPNLPWGAVVHVYGQREETYTDQAAAQFQDAVLPQVAAFLHEELVQRVAIVPEPRDLFVRRDATGHSVTISRRRREAHE